MTCNNTIEKLGGTGPDVLLIHGYGADRMTWLATVPALTRFRLARDPESIDVLLRTLVHECLGTVRQHQSAGRSDRHLTARRNPSAGAVWTSATLGTVHDSQQAVD